MNTREYNILFSRMNIQTPQKTNLITGPKFFKIINEFDIGHEDYYQYMEDRKRKNTSRKLFCKEVLENLGENIRESVIARINQIADEFESEKTIQIPARKIFVTPPLTKTVQNTQSKLDEEIQVIDESIINPNTSEETQKEIIVSSNFVQIDEPTVSNSEIKNPKVFISYSWDDEEHKEWVLKLSADLRAKGIETILDRYHLRTGVNASVFMEESIIQADKVLIIFTEKYKTKASVRAGGVGTEYSMMSIDLCRSIAGNKKYFPILRRGSYGTSIPLFLQPYIASYMTNDEEYEEKLTELVHAIFDKSIISPPKIGEIPDYIKK